MHTKIHWITESFGTMPRPRGNDWLEDEILGFKRQGATALVVLLEGKEVTELGLTEEDFFCKKNEIEFIPYPILDYAVPSNLIHFEQFIEDLLNKIDEGKRLAIHCHAGIGRSTIVACSILIKQGFSTENALALITKKRGLAVPDTKEQVNWLKRFEGWLKAEK